MIGDRAARLDGQLAGAEELLAIDRSINDPLIDVSRRPSTTGAGNRLEVVVVLELGIDVLFPVELFDQVVDVLMVGIGNVLDQELPRDAPAFDHRLVHAEDVRAPLGLVSNERAGGVQDARRNQPAGARLEAIGLGMIQYSVVSLVPALEAAVDIGLGRPRLQAEEGEREVIAGPVELGREVVALGLPLAAEQAACCWFWCMWWGIGPRLSKNLLYTGQRLYVFQRLPPIISDPNTSMASLSVNRSPLETT